MSFEVDRYSASWAHIALCADLTWAAEPPDDFITANQRLWAQHCRVSQVLQEASLDSHGSQANNKFETTDTSWADKRTNSNSSSENGGCSGRRSVKDVIPESRLAQFYGNFYYDEVREKCYVNANERSHGRGYHGQGCENSDLTECWMLPEVEYWFRKLVDDSPERSTIPRRRRQYRMLPDDDFERWSPAGVRAGEEAALAAKVLSVRGLWAPTATVRPPSAPSPPPVPRKIRARRRQPRRLGALAPPPPSYCLEVPVQLFCDPASKFQFEPPRPSHMNIVECQRAMGRLSASVQAIMRATAARCPPYRGTNVSRYAPTGQRSARYPDKRYGILWPREHLSPRLNRFQLAQSNSETSKTPDKIKPDSSDTLEVKNIEETPLVENQQQEEIDKKSPENVPADSQPSTSTATIDAGLSKKRLYSTVLSMSAPTPIGLTPVGCVRLTQKLVTPGLLKLNPKIMLPTARIRPANIVDNKFEELEKEALEQYKASDESIDTKFRELEKQAVEQYNASNSNTSCSSGNSAEKQTSSSPSISDNTKTKRQAAKFHKEKVDSVVIYSQNFPDLNTKSHTNVTSLKNFHPPRGEKKGQTHRPKRSLKSEQRAASDTDYEAREATSKGHKGPLRWTLYVVPPKKRHLTSCVSDCSSDEDIEDASGSIKDRPCIKRHVSGKLKMSAHGGGDLHPIMRKT
ncbi:LOW QUALITY PROTEIN: uncharacterized protein ACR2FA_004493 [Aphomia sociella]